MSRDVNCDSHVTAINGIWSTPADIHLNLLIFQIIGYIIVAVMLMCSMQALAELAVLYPVNGAFYTYVVRFVDPSW